MELTSLRRVKLAYGFGTAAQDATLTRLISSGSKRIAAWLRRTLPDGGSALSLAERTEYFHLRGSQRELHPAAYPLQAIDSIAYDSTGRYDGDEQELDEDAYLLDGRIVHLVGDPGCFATVPRGLRVTYTGGLAASAVLCSRAITPIAEAMTPGHFVQGNLSGCVGYLTAAAVDSISMELLAGTPQAGETVTEYSSWSFEMEGGGPGTATTKTAVLGEALTTCLAETHPDLVEACEMHVDYMRRIRSMPEEVIVQRDGTNKASLADMQKDFFSIPHVRDLLAPYRNLLVTE